MKFYLIRHKATGQYMPLMKRGRGYSHWNPGNKDPMNKVYSIIEDIPRLIPGYKKAIRIAKNWAINANLYTEYEHSYYGKESVGLSGKPDGRKLEDIEIVLAILNIKTSRIELK